jgi:Protein kinase domain
MSGPYLEDSPENDDPAPPGEESLYCLAPLGTSRCLGCGRPPQRPLDFLTTATVPVATTQNQNGTALGAILGTAAYMSPEQAGGRTVDQRTDVWASACVLYEALTGKKPFEAETVADTLAAVVRAEPEWSTLPEATPLPIRRLLRRAPIKDSRRRLPHVGSARWELDDAGTETSNETGVATSPCWSPSFFQRYSPAGWSPVSPSALSCGRAQRGSFGSFFRQQDFSTGSMVKESTLGQARDIGALRVDGSSEPVLLLDSPFNEHSGVLSSDDGWLAYVSDESEREEICVRAFPSLAARIQVSTEGGTEPLWSRDGTELFYRQDDRMMSVRILSKDPDVPQMSVSKPQVLFEGRFQSGDFGGNPGTNYDVSEDGRFVMIQEDDGGPEGTTDPESRPRLRIRLILHWTEELKRLAPTGE